MRVLGTVLKVLNLISRRHVIPFPIIDPTMTTAFTKTFKMPSNSRHELVKQSCLSFTSVHLK